MILYEPTPTVGSIMNKYQLRKLKMLPADSEKIIVRSYNVVELDYKKMKFDTLYAFKIGERLYFSHRDLPVAGRGKYVTYLANLPNLRGISVPESSSDRKLPRKIKDIKVCW